MKKLFIILSVIFFTNFQNQIYSGDSKKAEEQKVEQEGLRTIFERVYSKVTNRNPAITNYDSWIDAGINSPVDQSDHPLLAYALFFNMPDDAIILIVNGATNRPHFGRETKDYLSRIRDEYKRERVAAYLSKVDLPGDLSITFERVYRKIIDRNPAITNYATWMAAGIDSPVDLDGQSLLAYALENDMPNEALQLVMRGATNITSFTGRETKFYLPKISNAARRKEIAGYLG